MKTETPDPLFYAQLIVLIAREQDRAAFGTLFDYFAPRLKGFLMRGGTTADQADELAQETMLMVWRKAALFDPARASASTWIYTIARNLRVDAARRGVLESVHYDAGQNAAESLSDEVSTEGLISGAFQDGVDVQVAQRQRAQRVQEAIGALPEDQSKVVMLAFFYGKAHADVAQELSLPLGTVKSRLRLATQKLRSLLSGLADS